MKKDIFKLLCAMGTFAMNPSVSYAQDQTTFIITTENNDNDDTHVNRPHRAPALADVSGIYEASSGTLSLCASFDVACVRIYKDDALIMEDNHPVTDDGTLYYNLSFYGSGAYRICLYDEDGSSYMAWLSI